MLQPLKWAKAADFPVSKGYKHFWTGKISNDDSITCNLMQPALNALKSQKKRHLALLFLKDHMQLLCVSKQLQHLSEEDAGNCLVSAYLSKECLTNHGDDQHLLWANSSMSHTAEASIPHIL